MRPIGGLFFREGDGVDARKLVAKICDGGRVTKDDPRATASASKQPECFRLAAVIADHR